MTVQCRPKSTAKDISKLVRSVLAKATHDADNQQVKPKSLFDLYREVGHWGFKARKVRNITGNTSDRPSVVIPVGTVLTVLGPGTLGYEDCVTTDRTCDQTLATVEQWELVK